MLGSKQTSTDCATLRARAKDDPRHLGHSLTEIALAPRITPRHLFSAFSSFVPSAPFAYTTLPGFLQRPFNARHSRAWLTIVES